MSYASANGAQRLEVNSAATVLASATQGARSGQNGPALNGHIDAEAAAARASAALQAIGVSAALPATQAVVTSGVKINAGSVTGTGNFATFTVVGGVITGITLSAS